MNQPFKFWPITHAICLPWLPKFRLLTPTTSMSNLQNHFHTDLVIFSCEWLCGEFTFLEITFYSLALMTCYSRYLQIMPLPCFLPNFASWFYQEPIQNWKLLADQKPRRHWTKTLMPAMHNWKLHGNTFLGCLLDEWGCLRPGIRFPHLFPLLFKYFHHCPNTWTQNSDVT